MNKRKLVRLLFSFFMTAISYVDSMQQFNARPISKERVEFNVGHLLTDCDAIDGIKKNKDAPDVLLRLHGGLTELLKGEHCFDYLERCANIALTKKVDELYELLYPIAYDNDINMFAHNNQAIFSKELLLGFLSRSIKVAIAYNGARGNQRKKISSDKTLADELEKLVSSARALMGTYNYSVLKPVEDATLAALEIFRKCPENALDLIKLEGIKNSSLRKHHKTGQVRQALAQLRLRSQTLLQNRACKKENCGILSDTCLLTIFFNLEKNIDLKWVVHSIIEKKLECPVFYSELLAVLQRYVLIAFDDDIDLRNSAKGFGWEICAQKYFLDNGQFRHANPDLANPDPGNVFFAEFDFQLQDGTIGDCKNISWDERCPKRPKTDSKTDSDDYKQLIEDNVIYKQLVKEKIIARNLGLKYLLVSKTLISEEAIKDFLEPEKIEFIDPNHNEQHKKLYQKPYFFKD